MKSNPHITVVVEGGTVRDVYSTAQGVTVSVIDLDSNDDEMAKIAAERTYLSVRAEVVRGNQFCIR